MRSQTIFLHIKKHFEISVFEISGDDSIFLRQQDLPMVAEYEGLNWLWQNL